MKTQEMKTQHTGGTTWTLERRLSLIRGKGYSVAVHNDYRLNGEPWTFWLFTKDDDHTFVKGEGRTDDSALGAVQYEIMKAEGRAAAIAAWNRRPASDSALYRALKGLLQFIDPEVAAVSDVGLATYAKHAPDEETRAQAACVLAARAALASATPQGEGKGE